MKKKKNMDLGFCVGSLTFSTFSCPVGTFVPLLPCPLPSRRERKGRKAGKEGGEEREMKFVCISMCCKIPHYVQFLQIIYFIFHVNSILSHHLEFTLPPKAMLVPKSCAPRVHGSSIWEIPLILSFLGALERGCWQGYPKLCVSLTPNWELHVCWE